MLGRAKGHGCTALRLALRLRGLQYGSDGKLWMLGSGRILPCQSKHPHTIFWWFGFLKAQHLGFKRVNPQNEFSEGTRPLALFNLISEASLLPYSFGCLLMEKPTGHRIEEHVGWEDIPASTFGIYNWHCLVEN